MIEMVQWLIIIPMFCERIWEWFITSAYLSGKIPTAKVAVEWAPPRFESVNPLCDTIAAIMDPAYTTEQRKEMVYMVASFGKQTVKTLENTQSIGPNGGHYQIQPFAIWLYYWVTGQTSAIANMFDSWGGNWEQAFLADAAYIAGLAAFGSPSNLTDWATYPLRPWHYHRRNFTKVSTNRVSCTVRLDWKGNGDGEKTKWYRLVLTDGTNEATVVSDNGGDRTDGETITLDCDDLSAFPSSFTGWLKSEYTPGIGDVIWGIRGLQWPNNVALTSETSYINQQYWALPFLFIHNVGEMVDSFIAPNKFSREATESGKPSAANDWPRHLRSGKYHEAFWDQNQAAIYAIAQPKLS